MAEIGNLRERATFQTYDAGTLTYTDALGADVWCRVEQPSGQLAFRATSGVVQRRYMVTARYRSELDAAVRILWRSKTLEITEEANPDEHRNYLTFAARESEASATQREIDQRGVDVTLRRIANTQDVSQPWHVTANATTDVETQALIVAQKAEADGDVFNVAQRTVVTIILEAGSDNLPPLPGDQILYGTRTLVAETVERVSPMDPIECFSLICRE